MAAAELTLIGRISTASNATFLGEMDGERVVYKPIAGERPLWDFPDGTLAHREVAAYLVSQALGWGVVPRTWLGDGQFGPGMVQVWCEPDDDEDAVALIAADEQPPPGWCHVLDGVNEVGEDVSLLHEDSPAMRAIALFDAVTNNADRKGAHVLPMAGGHRYGVDHGLTFHAEPKLRTILWGWMGQPLAAAETAPLQRLVALLDDGESGSLGSDLARLLDESEVDALRQRCLDLLAAGLFPEPLQDYPAIPWPPI